MKLQQNTLLALYSALEFAGEPARQRSVADIAQTYRASPHHLAKVLRKLARAGLLHAVRGAGGGYRFAANPKRITLMDVIELFEDIGTPRRSMGAPGRRGARPEEHALEEILAEVDETAKAIFRSVTLETMVKRLR